MLFLEDIATKFPTGTPPFEATKLAFAISDDNDDPEDLNDRAKKLINQLCIGCHAGKHYGKVDVNNHPVLNGLLKSKFKGLQYDCTDCHDPHGSDVSRILLIKDIKDPDELCKKCHPQYF